MVALNTAFMTDGAVIDIAARRQAGQAAAAASSSAPAARHASSPRATSSASAPARTRPSSRRIVTLPGAAAAGQSQHAERHCAWRGRPAGARQTDARGAGREPSGDLAGRRSPPGATYRAFQFTAGTGLVRNGVALRFAGEGAKARRLRLFPGARHRTHRHHAGGRPCACRGCESRELFKGVLADQARGVVPGQGDRAARCAEDRRQADGPGADAVARMPSSIPSPSLRSTPTTWCAAMARPRPRSTRICFSISARAAFPRRGSARPADRKLHRRGDRQGRGRGAARGADGRGTRRLAHSST